LNWYEQKTSEIVEADNARKIKRILFIKKKRFKFMKKLKYFQARDESSLFKRLLKIMKLTLFALFMTSALASASSYSQATRLTLKFQNISYGKLFQEIENQTEFRFAFSSSKLDPEQTVHVNATKETLEEILDKILPAGIGYEIIDRYVVIARSNEKKTTAVAAVSQQRRAITGKVTDDTGEALMGVSVVVKGTTLGTTTDLEGNYSLADVAPDATLVFSFVGMQSQEIKVNGRSMLSVTLEESSIALNEVVAVGYGATRRSDLVSSSTTVSVADVKSLPSTRVDDMLQGRSTGLVIQSASSGPDPTFNIRIRGSNSISGSNEPLIVVDGFIGGDMGTINPNDIESIEVLKDASATAIYGSRGANGVILIQTKKGKSQKPVVEVNSFVSSMSVAKKLNLLNAGQYAELVNEVRDVFGQDRVFTEQEIAAFHANGGTDWQDEIFRQALQQSYQVSVAGGSDRLSYYLSGNLVDNTGIVRGSSFNRQAIRSNVNSQITDKLKLGLNLYYSASANHPNNMSRDSNPVNGAEGWAPTLPVYNPDGSYTLPAATYGPKSIYNPLILSTRNTCSVLPAGTTARRYSARITNGDSFLRPPLPGA
jgi:TonB-dependent SusC/RagA subfamily outer membrane receptor